MVNWPSLSMMLVLVLMLVQVQVLLVHSETMRRKVVQRNHVIVRALTTVVDTAIRRHSTSPPLHLMRVFEAAAHTTITTTMIDVGASRLKLRGDVAVL